MKIEKIMEEGKVVYHISGRVDTQTAPELQTMIDESFKNRDVNLVLDFQNVEYMSSAGLRTVLYAQKVVNTIEGASLVLINVKPVIMDVFEMTGFTEFLTINP